MNTQQIKGNLVKARGGVEAFLGRLTGNRKQQVKGVAHEAEGNLRKGIGDVQQVIEHPTEPEPTTP